MSSIATSLDEDAEAEKNHLPEKDTWISTFILNQQNWVLKGYFSRPEAYGSDPS